METKRGKDTSGGSGPLSPHVGLLKPFRGALKKVQICAGGEKSAAARGGGCPRGKEGKNNLCTRVNLRGQTHAIGE